MEIKPQFGLDKLLFGMKKQHIEQFYGQADAEFKDEDENQILVYNQLKARLTLYADEDFRLGYIVLSHPDVQIKNEKIIGTKITDAKQLVQKMGMQKFEEESFDTITNYFNEDYWMILQAEYGEIIKVEIGAVIKNQDEFDWKFQA
jgi:hypothetical protein